MMETMLTYASLNLFLAPINNGSKGSNKIYFQMIDLSRTYATLNLPQKMEDSNQPIQNDK